MSHSVLHGQVKLWYDNGGSQLMVTVLGAKALPVTDDGRPRNPYVQIYFLPDRSEKSKRRTKTVKKSVEPRWNQTYMYAPVHRHEFRNRMLELTSMDVALYSPWAWSSGVHGRVPLESMGVVLWSPWTCPSIVHGHVPLESMDVSLYSPWTCPSIVHGRVPLESTGVVFMCLQ
ncbi:Regulating synaptic membrane exocytosis protein 2 [Liparis tanakae]|uniref:Regulating synaptic membrane exocytosis protein 2 n=1 Tax=Liparis tanakae TaxID=230148 RepID=A0A4Z2GUQ5_9TELE|nr:Regulating synaptic membrane exocytosis protein 2 [Liparis tanakae]